MNRLPLNEKLVRINSMSDARSCINWPTFSDVQDETICDQLVKRGLTLRDAQHISQAVSNGCNVFLARDEKTIITKHRPWIEENFPITVRLPSELLADLDRQ